MAFEDFEDNASHAPNILELIDGAPFPMTKAELVQFAQDQDASEEALDFIQAMPDITYRGVKHFNNHMGELEDLPSRGNFWSSAEAEVGPAPDDALPAGALPDGTDRVIIR